MLNPQVLKSSILKFELFDIEIVWDDSDFARYASYVEAGFTSLSRRSARRREGGNPRQLKLKI